MIFVVSVLLQTSTAAPSTVDLTKFSPGIGARYTGTTDSQTARTLSFIGDHNGDGFEDYMVSCWGRNGIAVIVMKRNTTNVNLHIPDIVSGQYFRLIKGVANTGGHLAGLGDINSDGFDDVLISSGSAIVTGRKAAGYAVVIFGKRGPFTDIILTESWPASSIGFTILGIKVSTAFRAMQYGENGIGDVNGDGLNDFAVTTAFYEGTTSKYQPGVVWIIFGKAKEHTFENIDLLPANFGSNGVYYTGGSSDDQLGFNFMTAGDFNGDGIADILMGAHGFDPVVNGTTRSGAGAAYLIFGSKTALATTDLSTFETGAKGVRFLGATADDQLGWFLSGVGDINGDGIDDIAIGAPGFDRPLRSGCGAVYVIYGNKGAYTADVDLANFAASIYGFVIYGRAPNMQLCTSSPASDLNGDGVNDLLVGGTASNSRVHIIYGQKEERTANVDTASDDVMTFFYVTGANLGYGLHGGKDVTGDGIPDILMGAHRAAVTLEGSGAVLSGAGMGWMLPGPFILPSSAPTTAPLGSPTMNPSVAVTASPSALPSFAPSHVPSETPSLNPSVLPSLQPSVIATSPTVDPTFMPSVVPTRVPTMQPSGDPSFLPTLSPTSLPTVLPTLAPSAHPTINPSASPTVSPTAVPSANPTVLPSGHPSFLPTRSPTSLPTVLPTLAPSAHPTINPSASPGASPTAVPSVNPTVLPSGLPTVDPSASPTVNPTAMPTRVPSVAPTTLPTSAAVKNFELAVNVEQVPLILCFSFMCPR